MITNIFNTNNILESIHVVVHVRVRVRVRVRVCVRQRRIYGGQDIVGVRLCVYVCVRVCHQRLVIFIYRLFN